MPSPAADQSRLPFPRRSKTLLPDSTQSDSTQSDSTQPWQAQKEGRSSQGRRSRKVGTTIFKFMQLMAEKGLLVRDESQCSHVDQPKQKADVMQRSIVKDFISRVFAGSTEKLVMQALSTRKASPKEIAKIRAMLDELDGESR